MKRLTALFSASLALLPCSLQRRSWPSPSSNRARAWRPPWANYSGPFYRQGL